VKGYNDITPRVGVAYDVFGSGKTAVKVNIGRYLQAATIDENYWANNPALRTVELLNRVDARQPNVVDCTAESRGPEHPGNGRRQLRCSDRYGAELWK
jgi:hypothetical protein